MAVNPMKRKARNMFLLGMLLMLVIGGVAVGILIWQMTERDAQIKKLTTYTVQVLNKDIESGATITSEDLDDIKQSYSVENPIDPNLFPVDENSGWELKAYTTLRKGTTLTNDMVYAEATKNVNTEDLINAGLEVKVSPDTRLQEYNMIKLPSKLENGNYIDIRLTLPTGQDFVVVSHKEVIECDKTTVWLKMSEDEMAIMNNAIIEYFVMNGSELYANIYDKAGLQSPAEVTYAMSAMVAYAFRSNPNILNEVKTKYEEKIADGSATKQINDQIRTFINQQLNIYNDDRLGNIESGVEQSRERQQEKRNIYITDLNALQN